MSTGKIYTDPEKTVDDWFKNSRNLMIERLKALPSVSLSTYAEPRIRKLYTETYFLFSLGFYNSGIVVASIMLEAMLKEIIFFKEHKDLFSIVGERQSNFFDAIEFCKKKGYITENEANALHNFRKKVRNLYFHSHIEKFTEGIKYPAWAIDYKNTDELKNILKGVKERGVKSVLGEPKLISGKELRTVSDIAKGQIEEREAIPFFLEVDEFIREMIKRHFKKGRV